MAVAKLLFKFLFLYIAVSRSNARYCNEDQCEMSESSSWNPNWWRNMVLYQAVPRSFKDSNGDGFGDFVGMIDKLEYFVEAGIDAILLPPFRPSPDKAFGYDVTKLFEVDKKYGTMKDFETLIYKAHQLGLKVILEESGNHISTSSSIFKKSAAREKGYEDFIIWGKGRPDHKNQSNHLVPSNWLSVYGGSSWEWHSSRKEYYLHQFGLYEADVNHRNPQFQELFLSVYKFWLGKGVDGFAMNVIPYYFEAKPNKDGVYPNEPRSATRLLKPDQVGYTNRMYTKDLLENYRLIAQLKQLLIDWDREHNQTKILIAEAYSNISRTMMYYEDPSNPLGANFPFNFDMITDLNKNSNAHQVVGIIERWFSYMPFEAAPNWQLGNHYHMRVASRLGVEFVDGCNMLILMLPGIACTYQGEEIGMADVSISFSHPISPTNDPDYRSASYQRSRAPARTPFQWDNTTSAGFSKSRQTWLPVSPDYMELNLRKQKWAPRSHYKVYQAMTKLRKQPVLSQGDRYIVALSNEVVLLIRYHKGHKPFALIFNVARTEVEVDLSKERRLSQTMEVYTSSVFSSRKSGDIIHRGSIHMKAGEALVVQLTSSIEICF